MDTTNVETREESTTEYALTQNILTRHMSTQPSFISRHTQSVLGQCC